VNLSPALDIPDEINNLPLLIAIKRLTRQ